MCNGQWATGNGNGNGTINQMMEATKSSGMAPCATVNGKGNGNGIESNNQPDDGLAWRLGAMVIGNGGESERHGQQQRCIASAFE
jgi:hypothetical protein